MKAETLFDQCDVKYLVGTSVIQGGAVATKWKTVPLPLLSINLLNAGPFPESFTFSLSNIFVIKSSLETPLHLKYVATLPCGTFWLTISSGSVLFVLPCIQLQCHLFSMLWCCWLGDRKSIWPVEKWVMRCWHGYLSEARCKWFAYGPVDATATRFIEIQIGLTFLVHGLPRLSWKRCH